MGGPLVLLPRDALQVWTGAYGPDGEDDVDEEETDYWWVGEEVEDYADAVEVRGVSALILANGKSPTTFVPTHRSTPTDHLGSHGRRGSERPEAAPGRSAGSTRRRG